MKQILFFLSLIALTGCSLNKGQADKGKQLFEKKGSIQNKKVSHLVDTFFKALPQWNISNLNQYGKDIATKDTSLHFLPFINNVEKGAFVFYTVSRKEFEIFEKSTFLSETSPDCDESYCVWRKMIKNHKVLDISIEPHPTLGWVFIVRKRPQQ